MARSLRFRAEIQGLGIKDFRIEGLEFRVKSLGFRV